MKIYSFLQNNKIEYKKFDHQAVFTCEEAEQLCPRMSGEPTKNLFLKSKAGDYFLIILKKSKRADLKCLAEELKTTKLSFGSPQELKNYLGIEPGAVTLLALINDPERKIKLVVDNELQGQAIQCHPLVNTSTLVISPEGIEIFLRAVSHEAVFVKIPTVG